MKAALSCLSWHSMGTALSSKLLLQVGNHDGEMTELAMGGELLANFINPLKINNSLSMSKLNQVEN